MTADWQLVITSSDPARAATFWCAALGYVPQPPPTGHRTWDAYARAAGIDLVHGRDIDAAIDPTHRRPRLLFVRDDSAHRGDISLELLTARHAATSDRVVQLLEAETSRLVGHGAAHVRTVVDADHTWVELRDPDRNPFRVM